MNKVNIIYIRENVDAKNMDENKEWQCPICHKWLKGDLNNYGFLGCKHVGKTDFLFDNTKNYKFINKDDEIKRDEEVDKLIQKLILSQFLNKYNKPKPICNKLVMDNDYNTDENRKEKNLEDIIFRV